MKRWQKNITLSPDNLDYTLKNFGKIPLTKIAKEIKEPYNKVRNNLILFGVISNTPKQRFFNVDELKF